MQDWGSSGIPLGERGDRCGDSQVVGGTWAVETERERVCVSRRLTEEQVCGLVGTEDGGLEYWGVERVGTIAGIPGSP